MSSDCITPMTLDCVTLYSRYADSTRTDSVRLHRNWLAGAYYRSLLAKPHTLWRVQISRAIATQGFTAAKISRTIRLNTLTDWLRAWSGLCVFRACIPLLNIQFRLSRQSRYLLIQYYCYRRWILFRFHLQATTVYRMNPFQNNHTDSQNCLPRSAKQVALTTPRWLCSSICPY